MTQQRISGSNETAESEIVLSGRAVSRGVGIGTALCLHGRKRQFYRREILGDQVTDEIERFRNAVSAAKVQLTAIASDGAVVDGSQAQIFETHKLFLQDLSLLKQIESMISEQRVNAEWAVKSVIDKYVSRYKSLTDKHLQEKYIDLEDVGERLLSALGGGESEDYVFDSNTIIVAKELNPSTLIELSKKRPGAIVTENGGWTSHTFILARELDLPAVTGIRQLLRSVASGDKLIVDGFSGRIILRPGAETENALREISERTAIDESGLAGVFGSEPETLDGHKIILRANLDISRDYDAAARLGASGIGLYRSEFLFNQYRGFPSEEEQVESYRKIAREADGDEIRIRTFDLSVNQIAGGSLQREKNPALGLRGIRLSMRYEDEFRTQIRALLRASAGEHISIVFPMVSDGGEVRWAKRVVDEESRALRRSGEECGEPAVGAMIEVPAAVLVIDRILAEVDFINIGTNDLVQYLLAVDRDNEEVADWFRTAHSAVLACLSLIIKAAERVGKEALVCGEMAGSPLYLPLLLGLGAREFSMNVNSLARIRRLVTKIAVEECQEVLEEVADLPDDDDRDENIYRIYHRRWSNLMDFENLVSFRRR